MCKPGVLVIHNRYWQAGGEDSVVRAEVALLRQHGHRVTEFSRDNAVIARYGPVHKASLFLSTTWNHRVYEELRRLIRQERPAVAHCHNLVPLVSPAAYYACRAEGVPVVQTLHNFRLRCPAGTMFHAGHVCRDCDGRLGRATALGCYRGSRTQTAAMALMLGIHRWAGTFERLVDKYSAPSEFCAQRMSGKDISRDKIAVRPNFLLKDPGARHASEDFALFVGRLCEEKGVRQIMQAWRRMPHIPLVVVGDGPLGEESQRTASKNVIFTGVLPPAETLSRMKAARFLVFPSLGYETFGVAVLEAGGCGVATVGSRLGAIPELVQERRTGLLFDPHNVEELVEKVEWAWSHPVSMNEMGAAARAQYRRHFTAEKAYEGLASLYSSVSPSWMDESVASGAVA